MCVEYAELRVYARTRQAYQLNLLLEGRTYTHSDIDGRGALAPAHRTQDSACPWKLPMSVGHFTLLASPRSEFKLLLASYQSISMLFWNSPTFISNIRLSPFGVSHIIKHKRLVV